MWLRRPPCRLACHWGDDVITPRLAPCLHPPHPNAPRRTPPHPAPPRPTPPCPAPPHPTRRQVIPPCLGGAAPARPIQDAWALLEARACPDSGAAPRRDQQSKAACEPSKAAVISAAGGLRVVSAGGAAAAAAAAGLKAAAAAAGGAGALAVAGPDGGGSEAGSSADAGPEGDEGRAYEQDVEGVEEFYDAEDSEGGALPLPAAPAEALAAMAVA
jgi:hypothetical protein